MYEVGLIPCIEHKDGHMEELEITDMDTGFSSYEWMVPRLRCDNTEDAIKGGCQAIGHVYYNDKPIKQFHKATGVKIVVYDAARKGDKKVLERYVYYNEPWCKVCGAIGIVYFRRVQGAEAGSTGMYCNNCGEHYNISAPRIGDKPILKACK